VVVDQLSMPYRIALVALLAVGALWFTVLRPKAPAPEPATTAPGATGLASDVSAAKGAAAASEASAAATQTAVGGATESAAGAHAAAAGAKAAPGTSGKAAKAPNAATAMASDRSAPLLRALDRDRAVVLLFFSKRGLEDTAVRRAVADVDRRNGRVVVKAVPVSEVGRYQAITRGVQVLQAPTTLVIAPGKSAKPVVGYTTTAELDQAAGDALAAKKSEK
jgi:cytoskeletal protein RodZ